MVWVFYWRTFKMNPTVLTLISFLVEDESEKETEDEEAVSEDIGDEEGGEGEQAEGTEEEGTEGEEGEAKPDANKSVSVDHVNNLE